MRSDAEPASLAALARHLGVSDRHLRRIFAAEHGVTPLQYLQTRRLLLAKQLLTDTTMPVAQVAHASGFRSLRRFNAAFADNYRLSPTQLRGEAAAGPRDAGGALGVMLGFREPLARDALLRFLGQRAIPGIEQAAPEALRVRRTVRPGIVGEQGGWIEAVFMPQRPRLRLTCSASLAPASGALLSAVRRWLDLDADPQAIDAALQGLPGREGLRLPGGVDAFELAVRAVLGQQVSVAAARTLAQRLVHRFGEPMATPWPELDRCFPAPAVLASAPLADVAALGIIRTRAAAIVALAQAWPELQPLLQAHAPAAPLIERLSALPGIGPWTAHYIALRALGWADAFPPGDVAVLNALGLPRGARAEREAEARSQAWRPCRAYAVLRLWDSLPPPARPPGPRRQIGHTCPPGDSTMTLKSLAAACTAQITVATPLGPVLLARTESGLAGAWFDGQAAHPGGLAAPQRDGDPLLHDAASQLDEYFAGTRSCFDLALDLRGTEFQRKVWNTLLRIPSGQTVSYGDIARAVGSPRAVRAVGAAVGRNPVGVIVPCHRVLGSDGSLTGYAGGLQRKSALLRLEGVLRATPRPVPADVRPTDGEQEGPGQPGVFS